MSDDRTIIHRPTQATGAERDSGCLVVLSGHALGRMFRFGGHSELLLGRGEDATIQLQDPGTSRRHAMIRTGPAGELVLFDLGSTNGTFVNGERIQMHVLQDGDRIQLGTSTVLKFSYQDSLEQQFQQQLYESATRDALTGAYNKRYFEDALGQHFSHAVRHGSALSLLIFDLDHFKRINDTYGHTAGDAVLRILGDTVARTVRNEDVFCRVGGEEFAVLARDTNQEQGVAMAERLRAVVEHTRFQVGSQEIPVTISLGVGTFDETRHRRPEALVEEVDRYLYDAKRSGRNRVSTRLEAVERPAANSG